MIYLKWLVFALVDWLMLVTVPFAAAIVSSFTRVMPYDLPAYRWGWLWGTYDNPPQGDEGFVARRAPFPGHIVGWRGYLNRVAWMCRNPLYGLARRLALPYSDGIQVNCHGDSNISDKYRRPGWYFATARLASGRIVGFEFYCVKPWSDNRDLRIRIGWKLMTEKFQRLGFAPLVNSFNPFDGYGNN